MLTVIDFIELPIASFKTASIDALERIEDDLNKKGLHSYCDCCNKSIKNIFVVYDSETDKTLCLGTECIKTYKNTKEDKTIKIDSKLQKKKYNKIEKTLKKLDPDRVEDYDLPF